MSELKIFSAGDPSAVLFESSDPATITESLGAIGVRFERWEAQREIREGAGQDEIIEAYRQEVDALMNSGGYATADVITVSPDSPGIGEMREKFLSEHTHAEDEVRFFVAGGGLFTMHVDGKVYEILCAQGDLMSVPAMTRHWFDMGPSPDLTVIRIFTNPEGWVAQYTGSDIADRFSRLGD